ncbi:hypothetical protein EBZ80_06045 [bacterium]|nr:hypothetical protein [bacterium]
MRITTRIGTIISTLVLTLTFAMTKAALANGKAPTGKTTRDPGPATDQDSSYVVRSSTRIDFSEANIDGRMKAPEGFFLQGRKSQDLQNLLKLRSNFRDELSGSAAAAEIPSR